MESQKKFLTSHDSQQEQFAGNIGMLYNMPMVVMECARFSSHCNPTFMSKITDYADSHSSQSSVQCVKLSVL